MDSPIMSHFRDVCRVVLVFPSAKNSSPFASVVSSNSKAGPVESGATPTLPGEVARAVELGGANKVSEVEKGPRGGWGERGPSSLLYGQAACFPTSDPKGGKVGAGLQ